MNWIKTHPLASLAIIGAVLLAIGLFGAIGLTFFQSLIVLGALCIFCAACAAMSHE